MSLEQKIAHARAEVARIEAGPHYFGKSTTLNILKARIAYWSLKLTSRKDRPSGNRISWN